MIFTAVITARSSLADKPPRLALRFAVYTGLALVVVAVAMLWVLERDVEARAEQRAVAQTQEVAEATLRRHLSLPRRVLRPGRYVLRVTATGASGKVTRRIAFRTGRL